MSESDLQKELDFFKDNQDDLVKKHGGKFLAIKNQEVLGVYESDIEAYEATKKEHELGSFLIQHCVAGTDSYTEVFHSRVTM